MKLHKGALAEAAIQVLAEQGSRAFTHRAVDRRAGLPEGTASRYARTRSALLAMAGEALFAEDSQQVLGLLTGDHPAATATVTDVAALLMAATKTLLGSPERYRARMELQLDAARTPSMQGHYLDSRNAFVEPLAVILADIGLGESRVTADLLVTVIDGILHRQLIIGENALPDHRLVEAFTTVLDGHLRTASAVGTQGAASTTS